MSICINFCEKFFILTFFILTCWTELAVWINGAEQPQLRMHVAHDRTSLFRDNAGVSPLVPDRRALARAPLEDGENELRFQVRGRRSSLETQASLFVWEHDDAVVACCVEGALLRRDVRAQGAEALTLGRQGADARE